MRNFENLKKKSQNSALYSTHWPPDNWPDALDGLAKGLVANKCTKLEKISEILLLIVLDCPIWKSHRDKETSTSLIDVNFHLQKSLEILDKNLADKIRSRKDKWVESALPHAN